MHGKYSSWSRAAVTHCEFSRKATEITAPMWPIFALATAGALLPPPISRRTALSAAAALGTLRPSLPAFGANDQAAPVKTLAGILEDTVALPSEAVRVPLSLALRPEYVRQLVSIRPMSWTSLPRLLAHPYFDRVSFPAYRGLRQVMSHIQSGPWENGLQSPLCGPC